MDIRFELNLDNAFRFHTVFGNKPVVIDRALLYKPNPYIYQTVPTSALRNSHELVNLLLNKTRLFLGLRHFSSERSGRQNDITHMLICTSPYDLACIQSKARNQTRRGLERINCLRVVPDDSIIQQLFEVYKDNVLRLKLFRNSKELTNRWKRWISVLREPDLVDLWIGTYEEKIVSFIVVVPAYIGGGEIVLHRSLYSALKYYPNNAMIYTILTYYFARGWNFMSYGMRAWNAKDAGLIHFKKNMGFKEKLWFQTLQLNPILGGGILRIDQVHKFYNKIHK